VWLLWMEGRVHGEFEAIKSPIGFIPRYEDLSRLFENIFQKHYEKSAYEKQFSINIPKLEERLERVSEAFSKEIGIPDEIFQQIAAQKERLEEARKKFGKEIISPLEQ